MNAKQPLSGPLKGIRILDLSRLLPAPYATMMMADMGAEVIKIEDPSSPDYIRFFPPFIGEESANYLASNRSKKSLALAYNTPEGKALFMQLVKTADIVVESFRPGILDKQGIGYEAASQMNEKIIYVSVTGYGQSGPYSKKAGHDLNYISYTGLLGATGIQGGAPAIPAAQVADIAGGSYMTVIACLSALQARQYTGKGQCVDVSMLDSTLPLMTLALTNYWSSGEASLRGTLPLTGALASYNVYCCKDGKYVAMGILEPKFWEKFCSLVNRPDFSDKIFPDPENIAYLKKELTALFVEKTRDEWIHAARDLDVCLTPVLDIHEVADDTNLNDRGMIRTQQTPDGTKYKAVGVPLKFSATPAVPSGVAPALGQDTVSILSDLGLTEAEVQKHKDSGVIG